MQKLTSEGEKKIKELAQRYQVSTEAVMTLLQALVNGNGTMAQFNHPDLGGSGQWMQGGMTMVGDMFNNSLKATVDGLCTELSTLLTTQPFRSSQSQTQNTQQQQQSNYDTDDGISLFVPASSGSLGTWWPAEFGVPNATGSQNNVRYAIFQSTQRLVVDINGKITVYDTLDHQIGGVSQQQSAGASVTFTSQKGLVHVEQLPVVSGQTEAKKVPPKPADAVGRRQNVDANAEEPPVILGEAETDEVTPIRRDVVGITPGVNDDIFTKIEKLADLHKKGILTDTEFAEKKTELLSRL